MATFPKDSTMSQFSDLSSKSYASFQFPFHSPHIPNRNIKKSREPILRVSEASGFRLTREFLNMTLRSFPLTVTVLFGVFIKRPFELLLPMVITVTVRGHDLKDSYVILKKDPITLSTTPYEPCTITLYPEALQRAPILRTSRITGFFWVLMCRGDPARHAASSGLRFFFLTSKVDSSTTPGLTAQSS